MSATSEFRRLLDKNGIKWKSCGYLSTRWERGRYEFVAREDSNWLYVSMITTTMTPNQAIDMTLGMR